MRAMRASSLPPIEVHEKPRERRERLAAKRAEAQRRMGVQT